LMFLIQERVDLFFFFKFHTNDQNLMDGPVKWVF